MKKITAFLLTAMCAVTTACGESTAAPANAPGKTAAASAAPASGAENEPIVFAMPVTAVVEGIKQVETEINNILESRIHTVVKLEPISLADYNSQVGLMMSSGDQIDVVTVLGTFSQLISKNQLAPMNAYLEPYGAGAAQALGEKFLKAATVNGSVYAFPTLNGKAAALSIVLRKDMLEANNISLDHLTLAKNFKEYTDNLDALADVFAKLKAADPDKVMLTPLAAGNLVFPTALPGLDTLGDVYGVLGKDGATVTNFFEMDEYKTLLGYAHDWYEKGYVLQDAATTSEASNTFLSSGRTAGYFIVGEEGQAEQITTATGVDVAVVKILNPTITTTTINSLGFGIASTSKKPEAAMQFLNEMYTNADIVNLLDWGIEGVHYVKNADGTVGFPEGVDANNTTYGLNEDWLFGNQFLSYIWGEGRDTTIYGRLKANNDIAQYSPALGFTYDSAPVRNELTAAINVFNQYGPGLETGTVDPETELPKLIDALKTAGIDKIIAEKQRQLDAWKAAGN
ncbi:MAG: ABC transporter substrate-binding protein [Clostridiales bacterium]|jgi:putative aldouronate transport system substrate-binding protein|nr:ABC transporter substrate-binding protein [Clostridiales bacterium]